MAAAYSRMAVGGLREAEALEWAEATIGDVQDEARRGVVGQVRAVWLHRNICYDLP